MNAGLRAPRWLYVASAFAVLMVFTPACWGDFIWDDFPLIILNERLRSWANLGTVITSGFWEGLVGPITDVYQGVYRPVVSAAYLVQYQLFGPYPEGFHLVNVLLHVACTLLCVGWLWDRIESDPKHKAFGIAVGVALFALHPSRVESVAWISGSTDLWAGLWILVGHGLWRRRFRTGAIICFLLAFFSKEVAIALLPALWLDHWALGERRKAPKGAWAGLAASFALALVVRGRIVESGFKTGESLTAIGMRVIATLGHALERLFTPWPATIHPALRHFDEAGVETFASWAIAVGSVAVIAIATLAILAWFRPRLRPWLADVGWFAFFVGPTLNIVDIGSITLTSERFLYLPMLGVAAIAARGVAALATRLDGAPVRTRFSHVAALALVGGMGWMSWTHIPHLAHPKALWTYEERVNPQNLEAIRSLVNLARIDRDQQKVLQLCRRGYHLAQEQRDAGKGVWFALCQGAALVRLTPREDQQTLSALRTMYDRFVGTRVLQWESKTTSFAFSLPDNVLFDKALGDPQLVIIPRAEAHLLTGSYEPALRQLQSARSHFPNDASIMHLLEQAKRAVADNPRTP